MKLKKEFHKRKTDERLYQAPVPVIGLTGGIATGKSTVSEILKSEDIPVICADELVKEIYTFPDTLDYLRNNHSELITGDKINFSKLREKFFTDKKTKEEIEALIYSKLPEAWAFAIGKLSNPSFIIYDVPLLFERGLEDLFDITILVYASRPIQKARLIERDNISEELAENILNHQMDIEEKKKKADFVVDNSGDIEQLGESIENLLHQLLY